MAFYDIKFIFAQATGFAKNIFGDGDLPYIMKKAHNSESLQQSWGHRHFLSYGASKLCDTLLMTGDVMVFRARGVY